MQAIVCSGYGPPGTLTLQDVEKPVPKAREVLVQVKASSVNTQNLLFVTGRPRFIRLMGTGLRKPAFPIPGNDLAGRIEAVGAGVKGFQPGDEVFGDSSPYGFGAYAEYACVPEAALVKKPVNATFEEAAGACEAAVVALQGLRDKGRIQRGQKVLVFGASGGIGSYAVQIARHFGAEVTGVCSTGNLEWVRGLGADHVCDYAKEDFSRTGRRYDLIFAIAYRSIFAHWRALALQGVYVSVGGPSAGRIVQDMLLGPLLARKGGKRVEGGWSAKPNQADLAIVKDLMEAGAIKPVVDRRFPLREAGEALRYYGEGRHRGKLIITME